MYLKIMKSEGRIEMVQLWPFGGHQLIVVVRIAKSQVRVQLSRSVHVALQQLLLGHTFAPILTLCVRIQYL